jgi:hypothetical protein
MNSGMNRDRRNILDLVACGRLTAAEAERLLLAWNEQRELAWVAALCVGMAMLGELGRWIPPAAHWLSLQPLLHQAVWTLQHWMGGKGA